MRLLRGIGSLALAACLVAGAAPEGAVAQDHPPGSASLTALPLRAVPFEDLRAFRNPASNWRIAGSVQSDYQQTHSMIVQPGTGVLVNIPTADHREHLFTELEHGDLELKIELLVPKGSNSGIYFQQRYEIQIFDSWGVAEPQHSDLGGIYQRWDESRPAGSEGYEGRAPRVNAALAPGLWQEFHVLFRAPRFDASGNKISNARFDWVYVNGVLVHQNAELSGPTRSSFANDEVAVAPLMIQGDHGPVAFRNLRYKTFNRTHEVTLGRLNYKVFDYTGVLLPASFDRLPVLTEGVADWFNVEATPKEQYYAMWFSADLHVPVTGEYLFETQISKGGNLYIDGRLVIENDGAVDARRLGAIVSLDAGTHRLEVSYFQMTWDRYIRLSYEGPGMEKRMLGAPPTPPSASAQAPPKPFVVQPQPGSPEVIGGFVLYGGVKRTHTMSVGHPEGVHYSYDLATASLLKFWRDPFADVAEMWVGRGYEQVLAPLNAAVEVHAAALLAMRGSEVPDLRIDAYAVDDKGLPRFIARHGDITVEDEIRPGDGGGLTRRLQYSAGKTRDDVEGVIAKGEVELLPDGLYRINGTYYLRLDEKSRARAVIGERDGEKTLTVPVLRDATRSEIQYQIIW